MTAVNLGLNSRKPPYSDESFRGYLLRVTGTNGYRSVNDRLQLIGYKVALNHVSPALLPSKRLMESLAPHLRTSGEKLFQVFNSHWVAKILNDYNRPISNLLLNGVRLCPHCIAENAYLSVEWDCCLITCCIKHRCFLIEDCPECKKPLSWARRQIEQCRCGAELTQISPPLIDPDSVLYRITKSLITQKGKNVNKLLHAMARMCRPSDVIPGKPNLRSMKIGEISNLIEQSAGVAHSLGFRSAYKSWLSEERAALKPLGQNAIELPYTQYANAVTHKCDNRYPDIEFNPRQSTSLVDTGSIDPKAEAERLGIEVARLNHLSPRVSTMDVAYQVTIEQAAEVLGISETQVGQLVTKEVLSPLNLVKTLRHMYFDLREIQKLLPVSNDDSPPETENMTTIAELGQSKLPGEFGENVATVIQGLLSGTLNSYQSGEVSQLPNRILDRSTVIRFLHGVMLDRDEPITISQLARIMATRMENIIALEAHNLIRTNHWSAARRPGDIEVYLDSFKTLMTNYFSINRVCRSLGLVLSVPLKNLIDEFKPEYLGDQHPYLILMPQDRALSISLLDELVQRASVKVMYDGYRIF